MPEKAVRTVEQHLTELLTQATNDEGAGEEFQKLRELFKSSPRLMEEAGLSLARHSQNEIIEALGGTELAKELLRIDLNRQRVDLGADVSTAVERLIIENVLSSWLILHRVEAQFGSKISGKHTTEAAIYWTRIVSSCQARFLKACESLTKIRNLLSPRPSVQLNVAQDGGQQVNVQK